MKRNICGIEMNSITVSGLKSDRFRKKALWISVGIFMTISMGSAIVGSKWIFLALAFIPFLIYLFTMRPFVFLFGLYCFLVPFDSILAVSGGATITKMFGIGTIVALFMTGLFEKKIMKPDKIAMWWGFFVIFGVLSIFWAIRPEMMYHRIATLLVIPDDW
jgi:sulfite exporter TauE/SafE